MCQNLAEDPACKMPQILSPDFFDPEVMRPLAKDRFDFPANSFPVFPNCGRKIGRFPILGDRDRKFKVLSSFQLLFQGLGKIGAITDKKAGVVLGKFMNHPDIGNIARSQVEGLDHAYGVDLNVQSESIEGLRAQFLAEGSQSFKEPGSLGSHKAAGVERHAVHDEGCILEGTGKMAEKRIFDFPKIRRLPQKCDAGRQIGEEVSVELFKEPEQFLIRFKAEVLTDNLHGKDFAIPQLGKRTAFTEAAPREIFFHKIINFAEDLHDIIIQIHWALLGLLKGFVTTLSFGRRALFISN